MNNCNNAYGPFPEQFSGGNPTRVEFVLMDADTKGSLEIRVLSDQEIFHTGSDTVSRLFAVFQKHRQRLFSDLVQGEEKSRLIVQLPGTYKQLNSNGSRLLDHEEKEWIITNGKETFPATLGRRVRKSLEKWQMNIVGDRFAKPGSLAKKGQPEKSGLELVEASI